MLGSCARMQDTTGLQGNGQPVQDYSQDPVTICPSHACNHQIANASFQFCLPKQIHCSIYSIHLSYHSTCRLITLYVFKKYIGLGQPTNDFLHNCYLYVLSIYSSTELPASCTYFQEQWNAWPYPTESYMWTEAAWHWRVVGRTSPARQDFCELWQGDWKMGDMHPLRFLSSSPAEPQSIASVAWIQVEVMAMGDVSCSGWWDARGPKRAECVKGPGGTSMPRRWDSLPERAMF